jgi:hypothetical protein
MRAWPRSRKAPPPSSQAVGRRDRGRRSLQGRARQKELVGEHLNEATITRLGSILECGNMTGQVNCRRTLN